MTILAKVQNGVLTLPADAPPLPEGTEVQVFLPEPEDDFDRWVAKHAGTVDELPEDFAAEHDYYIHGTPRREPRA